MSMVELQSFAGATEVNHGAVAYPVDWRTDRVTVPAEVAAYLTHGAGFGVVATVEPPPPSAGHVTMKTPRRGGCAWGGQNFVADDEGLIRVPAEAGAELAGHGYHFV